MTVLLQPLFSCKPLCHKSPAAARRSRSIDLSRILSAVRTSLTNVAFSAPYATLGCGDVGELQLGLGFIIPHIAAQVNHHCLLIPTNITRGPKHSTIEKTICSCWSCMRTFFGETPQCNPSYQLQ
jgi:hypothetical protein